MCVQAFPSRVTARDGGTTLDKRWPVSICRDLSQSRSLLTKTSHRSRPCKSPALPPINSQLEFSGDDGLVAWSFCACP